MANFLQRQLQAARSEDEIAAIQTVAALSEDPQDAAQTDQFSTDPLTGYDAAQIALRLFDAGRLDEFASYLTNNKLSPNIILPSSLTLLQYSLFRYPQDEKRVECLLGLGANPNLFMRRIDEEGFGSVKHRAGYHPLNYAFANCPQLTTPAICQALRKYGASAEGLRNYFEVDPSLAVPDDEMKAALRSDLIALTPDPEAIKQVRRDVDLSVMQKHVVNIETQLAAAGFQIVSYIAPRKKNVRIAQPDTMIPIFDNFRVLTRRELNNFKDQNSSSIEKRLIKYSGVKDCSKLNWPLFAWEEANRMDANLLARLTASDPQEIFEWAPAGASASTTTNNRALAALKPSRFVFMDKIGQATFGTTVSGVYKDKANKEFFYDPSINGIRLLSQDNKTVSLSDRSDLFADLETSITYFEITEETSELKGSYKQHVVNNGHRPTFSAGNNLSHYKP